ADGRGRPELPEEEGEEEEATRNQRDDRDGEEGVDQEAAELRPKEARSAPILGHARSEGRVLNEEDLERPEDREDVEDAAPLEQPAQRGQEPVLWPLAPGGRRGGRLGPGGPLQIRAHRLAIHSRSIGRCAASGRRDARRRKYVTGGSRRAALAPIEIGPIKAGEAPGSKALCRSRDGRPPRPRVQTASSIAGEVAVRAE